MFDLPFDAFKIMKPAVEQVNNYVTEQLLDLINLKLSACVFGNWLAAPLDLSWGVFGGAIVRLSPNC